MKKISWLHTADLHLDAPIKGWKGTEAQLWKRHEEHRHTFRKMISLVKERQISFLLIAGDFLEHGYVSLSTVEFVLEQFQRIPDTIIFLSPGNHDPYRSGSVYTQDIWPDHVHIFRGKWERHVLPSYGLSVYGRGFTEFHEKSSSLPTVDSSDGYRIMLAHGDYQTGKDDSSYFPIYESEVKKLGFDYLALGHIHQEIEFGLQNERNTLIRYAGSPEAHNWKELGRRTVTIGELTDEGIHLQYEPIHTRSYEICPVDVSECETKENLLQRFLDMGLETKASYITLQLTGYRKQELDLQQNHFWLVGSLRQAGWRDVYIEDCTVPDFDLSYYREQNRIIGSFIQKMERRIEEEKSTKRKNQIRMALYKGLEALCANERERA